MIIQKIALIYSSAQTWQKFTFFNKTDIQTPDIGEVNVSEDGLLFLSQTQKGDTDVRRCQGPKRPNCHYFPMIKINQHIQLSFLPSADLQVLSRTASGSVIVTILDEQIGIGEAIAKLIWVTIIPLP